MKKKPKRSKIASLALLLGVMGATLPLCTEAAGMAFGPPLLLLQHLPLGKELDFKKTAGLVFTVYNRGKEPLVCSVTCGKPSAAGLTEWEVGYEELPDAAWAHLDKTELTIAPESQENVSLFVTIPEKPEHYNRRWLLAVTAAPKNASQTGVGLALAARVQLETLPAPAETDKPGAAGALSAAPALLLIEDVSPGESRTVSFLLRNNTTEELNFSVRRIREYFPPSENEDERQKALRLEKPLRYFGRDVVPLLDHSWAHLQSVRALKPGESQAPAVSIVVPANAEPGKMYEELLFLDGGAGRLTFVRIRTTVAAKVKEVDE
jgi:hypothetical protein